MRKSCLRRMVWVGSLKDHLVPAPLLDTFHQTIFLYFIIKLMFFQYLYSILFVCMLMHKNNTTNSLSLVSYSLSRECALCSPSLGAAAASLRSCNCKQRACHKQCTPLLFFFNLLLKNMVCLILYSKNESFFVQSSCCFFHFRTLSTVFHSFRQSRLFSLPFSYVLLMDSILYCSFPLKFPVHVGRLLLGLCEVPLIQSCFNNIMQNSQHRAMWQDSLLSAYSIYIQICQWQNPISKSKLTIIM